MDLDTHPGARAGFLYPRPRSPRLGTSPFIPDSQGFFGRLVTATEELSVLSGRKVSSYEKREHIPNYERRPEPLPYQLP